MQPILDRAEVYSGCYARVSINFYAFNSNGNRGIACGLGNIQKVRDGEPLGGRSSAAVSYTHLDVYKRQPPRNPPPYRCSKP